MTDPTKPADETIQYVREINVYDDAEDVKRVAFVDDATRVEVGITDEVMVRFVDVAEQVFDDIHADMAEMRDIFRRYDLEEDGES